MILTFYKNEEHRWYVNLPQWEGSIDELEMVCGADLLLDIIDKNLHDNGLVSIKITLDKPTIPTAYKLTLSDEPCDSGRYYVVSNKYLSNMTIWLCDVTKFVFDGIFPSTIYFNI